MRIQTNVESLNAYRNLGNTNKAMSDSMEKLSSGFRINRAADDAAGLAISEKMRGQVKGLDQATRNAQDSNSMIQTAEGALNESHEILQRMRELAVQSANDTNTDADRAEIQEEVNQLSEELTRIAENTEFNTQNLLDGTLQNTISHIGANEGQNIDLSIDDMSASGLNADELESIGTATIASGDVTDEAVGAIDADSTYNVQELDETIATVGSTSAVNDVSHVLVDGAGDAVAVSDDGATFTALAEAKSISDLDGTDNLVEGTTTGDISGDLDALEDGTSVRTELNDDGGIDVESATGLSVSSQKEADYAISTLDSAIETVSSQRSELGAVQNRLDHTIANLEVSSENLQAAESRIRDVDMAQEMTNFSKQQILEQAGTAMLAQANQAPQSVLQLLG